VTDPIEGDGFLLLPRALRCTAGGHELTVTGIRTKDENGDFHDLVTVVACARLSPADLIELIDEMTQGLQSTRRQAQRALAGLN